METRARPVLVKGSIWPSPAAPVARSLPAGCCLLPAMAGAEPCLSLVQAGSNAVAAEVPCTAACTRSSQLGCAGHPLPRDAQAGGLSTPGKNKWCCSCWVKRRVDRGSQHRGMPGLFQGEGRHTLWLWCRNRGMPKGRREKPASALWAVVEWGQVPSESTEPQICPGDAGCRVWAVAWGHAQPPCTGAGYPGPCQPVQPDTSPLHCPTGQHSPGTPETGGHQHCGHPKMQNPHAPQPALLMGPYLHAHPTPLSPPFKKASPKARQATRQLLQPQSPYCTPRTGALRACCAL